MLCSAGLGLASILLLVRNGAYAALLPVADFGRLNQLLLMASMVANFGGLGMQLLAQKLLPLMHARRETLSRFAGRGDFGNVQLSSWNRRSCRPRDWCCTGTGSTARGPRALCICHGAVRRNTCLTDVRSEMRLGRHAVFSIARAAGALAAGCAAVWMSRRVDWLLIAEGVATGGLGWLA